LTPFSNVAVKVTERNQESPDSVQAADKEADGLSSIVSLRSREKQPSPQLLDDQFEIDSNPLHWTQEDVYQYLIKTDDCADVAQKCKDEVQYCGGKLSV
jgi:hypothetical protein